MSIFAWPLMITITVVSANKPLKQSVQDKLLYTIEWSIKTNNQTEIEVLKMIKMTCTENMFYCSAQNALITDMLMRHILDIQYLRPFLFFEKRIMMFRNGIQGYLTIHCHIQFENKYNVADDDQQLTEMKNLYATCCSYINHKWWQGKHL